MLEEGRNDQKRIKSEEIKEKEEEEDRISLLPDYLLVEILSRLPSIKDAIRTGPLSKHWQHLWASVHTLIVLSPGGWLQNPKLQSDFVLWVDKSLTQCRQLKLNKFKVHVYYDIRFESKFHNWIRYAISCNVEELTLVFAGMKTDFVLDQVIFINSCFTEMSLTRCKLNPTGAISWENLTSLRLSQTYVAHDLIVNIVSGCPLLETLELQSLEWPYITKSASEADLGAYTSRLSLTQCRQLKHLKKFSMSTGYDIHFKSQFNSWILYAIRCNVKQLSLDLCNIYDEYDEFELDETVFTRSCFTKLRLGRHLHNPVGAISWKNLRSLCINNYEGLDEDMIENIQCGSPVLENLALSHCYGYRRLNITSKSVKSLVLIGYMDPNVVESEAYDINEINAPYILSLTIEDNILFKLLLLDVSSLLKAYLNYTCEELEDPKTMPTKAEQEMLKRYIMNIRHVKELELGLMSAKVLSCLQAQGFVFPANVKLTYVKYDFAAALALWA